MLRRSAAHIGCQQNMIFGHPLLATSTVAMGDDIAQGNAFVSGARYTFSNGCN